MFSWWKQHRTLLIIFAGGTLGFALLFWFPPSDILPRTESQARDFIVRAGRAARPNPQLVFLAIDKSSTDFSPGTSPLSPEEIDASPALQKMRAGFPWPRDVYPLIIDRLAQAGAKAIVFDLLFLTENANDPAFRAALDRYRDRVVIGCNFAGDPHAGGGAVQTLTLPSPSLIPQTSPLDTRVGFVNFWKDTDEVIRSARYRVTAEELAGRSPGPDSEVYESLATRALRCAGLLNRVPPGDGQQLIRFARPYEDDMEFGFAPHSLYEIFFDKTWNRPPYNGGALFRDKIVLVGPFGNWSKDFVPSPYGLEKLPGPVLHLNAINAALNGDFLRETSRAANLALVLLAGLAALGLSLWIKDPLRRFFTLLAGAGGYAALALLCYNLGTYILVILPLLTFLSTGFTWLVWEQVLDRLEKLRVRRTLERYVSKNVVKEILDNPASFLNSMSGQRRPVAILFTDIRGFTTLTESADSTQLVTQLNEYFSEMVKLIFEQKGSLDKFIGDAIMAVWGNVQTAGPQQDAELAVTCGLKMQAGLRKLNEQWKARGIPELHMGVGVNFGEVIVGNLGSAEKMEVTVIGDAVNLASRLEGLTKPFHQELIIGENVARLLSDRFHLLPVASVTVKGKTKPIEIFSVLGTPGEPLDTATEAYRCLFAEAMKHYRAQRFEEAGRLFRESLQSRPGDGLAELYIEECRELQAHPPGPEWNGVVVMTTK